MMDRLAWLVLSLLTTGRGCATTMGDKAPHDEFEEFFRSVEPRLRPALVASLGPDRGRDASAEALTWAFEHWGRVLGLTSPVSYLYRVGVSRTRQRKDGWLEPNSFRVPEVEPELAAALSELTDRQRTAVGLVSGYGWTLREVGELDDISPSTVAAHLRRGLEQLRNHLGVDHEPLV